MARFLLRQRRSWLDSGGHVEARQGRFVTVAATAMNRSFSA